MPIFHKEEECVNFCNKSPESLRELLEILIDSKVIIILESGEEEEVEIEAVIGNLLVAQIENECEKDCGELIKFIDIQCICAVIVKCEEVLENILRSFRCKKVFKEHEHEHECEHQH